MRLETFRGPDLGSVTARATAVLGDDALVLRTRVLREGDGTVVEVTAAAAREVEWLRRQLEPGPLPARGSGRPYVVALVGPTGAGKTTTLAKLATHAGAFGRKRVGLLTLDTYRAGALEQLGTYAEIAGLPLEAVYDAREVPDALKRLRTCDVVLVDTPGRSPRSRELNEGWRGILAAVAPDETHLVVPATVRTDVAMAVRDAFDAFGATHLLLTKLDEVPGETGVAELAMAMELPARWAADGQEIPEDLRPAGPRIVASLTGGPSREAA